MKECNTKAHLYGCGCFKCFQSRQQTIQLESEKRQKDTIYSCMSDLIIDHLLIASRVFGYFFFCLIGSVMFHSKDINMNILISILFLALAGHQLVKVSFKE